jgi:hypothetical protein
MAHVSHHRISRNASAVEEQPGEYPIPRMSRSGSRACLSSHSAVRAQPVADSTCGPDANRIELRRLQLPGRFRAKHSLRSRNCDPIIAHRLEKTRQAQRRNAEVRFADGHRVRPFRVAGFGRKRRAIRHAPHCGKPKRFKSFSSNALPSGCRSANANSRPLESDPNATSACGSTASEAGDASRCSQNEAAGRSFVVESGSNGASGSEPTESDTSTPPFAMSCIPTTPHKLICANRRRASADSSAPDSFHFSVCNGRAPASAYTPAEKSRAIVSAANTSPPEARFLPFTPSSHSAW